MKISAARIKQIIREEHKKIAAAAKISLDTEDVETPPPSKPAAASVSVVVQELKGVLEKWEETEYESDEARWREYAKDVQGLVGEYESGEKEEHTEEECEEVHPNQTHEEWEEKDDDIVDDQPEEEEKKKKSKKKESSSGSKSKSPKLAKMTYESKKKKLGNELVRMVKEELTSLRRGQK